MSSNPIRLQQLFDRYVHNNCSPAELDELWQLVDELSENDPVTDDIRDLWDARKASKYSLTASDSNSLYDRIMEKTRTVELDYDNMGRQTRPERMKGIVGKGENGIWMNDRGWKRMAAAACVAGLVIAGFLYYTKHTGAKTAGNELAGNVPNDARPGANKAILTLGNGSQIVLEGNARRQLASQGGARIEITDSGKLAYISSKDRTDQPEEKSKEPKGISNSDRTATLLNTLSTPRGGKYELKLADGTRVWLNASSAITYPTAFTGTERTVSVTGEAYFEVARNPKQPFRVKVNDMEIEVLGTSFNINAYNDEASVKTTLLEGSIRINKGKSTQLLKPGEQAQTGSDATIRLIPNADVEMELAWRNNEFYFKNADLATVLRQLSRWYDLDITYQDGAPLHKRFEGEIPMDAMASQVLGVLEKNGVHFRIEGKQLIVLP